MVRSACVELELMEMSLPINTKIKMAIKETMVPYFFAKNKKSYKHQAKELFSLYKKYKYLPYQYFRSIAYIEVDDRDIMDLVPPRIIQDARQRLNGENSGLVDDKTGFAERLEAAGLPTPRTLFTSDGQGRLTGPSGADLSDEEALARVVEVGGQAFAKLRCGAGGMGAEVLREDMQAIQAIRADRRSRIVQRRIEQHPAMVAWNESSLNTIRIDTFLHEGEMSFSGAYLRIGRAGSVVDNFSNGGVAVGINLETGRLARFGRQKPKFGTKIFTEHPDTGIVFEGQEIPFWPEVLSLVERGSEVARPLVSVGWDIAKGGGLHLLRHNAEFWIIPSWMLACVCHLYMFNALRWYPALDYSA